MPVAQIEVVDEEGNSTKTADPWLAIDFGVRVDSLAAVSVSKTPEECQFRVSLEWHLAR